MRQRNQTDYTLLITLAAFLFFIVIVGLAVSYWPPLNNFVMFWTYIILLIIS